MMMKEVLLLALVVWMAIPAHPWKPPDYGSMNDDDTPEIVEKPSSQTIRQNPRTRRHYVLHGNGYRYWDPTASNMPRQLRHLWKPQKSAWEMCEKMANENTGSKKNVRTLRNYILHGYWDPTGQEISRQLRGRANKEKVGNKDVNTDIISFDDFKSKFDKTYRNEGDERKRKDIFLNNVEKIEDHNKLYKARKSSYVMTINEFSDMNYEEFVSNSTCAKAAGCSSCGYGKNKEKRYVKDYSRDDSVKEPDDIDYRKCNAFKTITEQKGKVCWAHSVVSSIETGIFLKYGTRIHLSEHYLVDCCKDCAGDPLKAFEYVSSNGIALEDKYTADMCNDRASKTSYKLSDLLRQVKDKYTAYKAKASYKVSDGVLMVDQSDEAALKNALVNKGPFHLGIYASENFMEYNMFGERVFDEKLCNEQGKGDHAVVLVGYGTDEVTREDYWLIRNSYGERWRDGGYLKVARKGMKECKILALIPKII